MNHFELIHTDKNSNARAGILHLERGVIQTPIFMPVGTLGSMKAMSIEDVERYVNPDIILSNTYHLYLRPGLEVIEKAGGLHAFNTWKKPVLTDSGGYQVYSLASSRKIKEEGVIFQSHIDGSRHLFTPENVIETQRKIGADIMMAFDECTPYPCEYKYALQSMERTHRWLDRCFDYYDQSSERYGHHQILAPIVQGSVYDDLRKRSAEKISEKNAEINAIGGLSVGEPAEDIYKHTKGVCDILPKSKARYLMGVGTPQNLLECIERGVDMFDCVLPTRNARHGLLYTKEGIINIKNKKWSEDFSPIDPESTSPYSCRYSKAYLRHLIHSKEYFGAIIASVHNLCFYLSLVRTAREEILKDNYGQWKGETMLKLTRRL